MAKRVRLSDDSGVSWYTLPGNTAELTNEAGQIDDTIFGQNFASTQTGLIGAIINANGLFKGFAGYKAVIKKSGSSTGMTSEAMTQVGSSKTYFITDATKNFWDHNVTPTFLDGVTPIDPEDIESIDYLFGRVTLDAGYTVVGTISLATGSYIPMTQIARGTAFSLTQQSNMVDDTDFETAQSNDGHREFIYGLKTVSLEITGIYAASNAFKALLEARAEICIEINPDGNNKSVARGLFKAVDTGQSGDVGDQEQETINFALSVPDDEDLISPFKWLHANDTTLSRSLQIALAAWEDNTIIEGQYLPNGVTGFGADVLVQDISLGGGLEDMNEFTVALQVSGKPVAVT